MSKDLWFADSEVFAHDTLWCFKRQRDGETVAVWNDPERVAEFIEAYRPVLCGYNFKDYDAYILKATLLAWTPEETHHVSETIIDRIDWNNVWALFQGHPWVDLPPFIDLYHDIVPRRSLKVIEANIGMSIVESPVSFDIDRPLTPAERDEAQIYCLHDLDATEALYSLRFDYVKAKSDLCELRGVDPLTMLKHSNARIVSEVLEAQRLSGEVTHGTKEFYEVPANVDRSAIPEVVLAYFENINTDNCENTGETNKREFLFHGCPTTVGLGGIHAAVPAYRERQSDERVILLQDIGSYYPSLILNNGYMSRAVADHEVYRQFYDLRMKAKAKGDKATADAAKLVLNTTFGTMKDAFNKMYDPMMNTRVCLSGQLYILDLITQIYRHTKSVQLIQLNTDGWIISCNRNEQYLVNNVVDSWQRRTGFTVDTHEVEKIIQSNVNNYVLRTKDGAIKAKGGVVARYVGGDFQSNSATIIDAAVVDYLLDGKSIDSTIESCDDIERFQIVARAGHMFQRVVQQTGIMRPCEHEYKRGVCTKCGINRKQVEYECREVVVQRVNRVYATTDDQYGGIFKVKMEAGEEVARQKIPLTPEHCWIDNANDWKTTPIELTTLDRSWYVSLANRKIREFVTRSKEEREQMSEVEEKTNDLQQEEAKTPAPRSRKKAVEPPVPFPQKLLQLQIAMAAASTGVSFDSVQSFGNKSTDYADTQQYKMWLRDTCSNLGLIFSLSMTATKWLGVITPPGTPDKPIKPEYGTQVNARITIRDAESDASETYGASGLGVNVTPGHTLGVAQTNLLRNFILNQYLLDNKGREGDDVAMNNGAPSQVGTFVSGTEKAAIKNDITEAKAKEAEFASDLFAKAFGEVLIEALACAEGKPEHETFVETAKATLAEHFEADGVPKLGANGKPTLPREFAVLGMAKAEEIVAEGAGAE